MFRSFTALLLLSTLMLTQFSKVFVYAGFELNEKYIVSTLCENRDKPELHCNGKCYLTRKLKQAEEKEKRQEREAQKKGAQDVFIVKSNVSIAFPLAKGRKAWFREKPFQLPENNFDIPHPPPAGILS